MFALAAAFVLAACKPAQPTLSAAASTPSFSVAVVTPATAEVTAPSVSATASSVAAPAESEQVFAAPPGASTVQRRGALPTVRRSETMVGPSYPPDLVKMVIRRAKPGFRKCVDEVPSFSARGELSFTIETDGRVKDATYRNGNEILKPNASQQCVIDVIHSMEFVAPRGRVTVRYPLGPTG